MSTKDTHQIIMDVWEQMRTAMNKPAVITSDARGPAGKPLADDLLRYARLLSRGGAFRGVAAETSAHNVSAHVAAPADTTREIPTQDLDMRTGGESDAANDFEPAHAQNVMARKIEGPVTPSRPIVVMARERRTAQSEVLRWDAFLEQSADLPYVGDKKDAAKQIETPKLHNENIKRLHPGFHKLYQDGYAKRVVLGLEDENVLDERISEIHEDFPWMAAATEKVWISLRRKILDEGVGTHFSPLLLLGPAGVGKTTWANRVSEAFGLGRSTFVDAAAAPSGMTLAGLEAGWNSAMPGNVVVNMLEKGILNPVVVVDEIDKATVKNSTGGASFGITNSLLGMMGPASGEWKCPFYHVNFDMRQVSWILTANDASGLSSWLLSRVTVIDVPYPSANEMEALIGRMCTDADVVDLVIEEVHNRFAADSQVSPRLAERMIKNALDRKSTSGVNA